MTILIEDKHWKIGVEEREKQFRFIINHQDTIEITTSYIKFNKEILFIGQEMLKDIIKEIDKGKKKSKYDSLELLEDMDGQFLVTIDLNEYHNFELKFINYSSEFQLELSGHANDLFGLNKAIDLIVQIVGDKNALT